MEISGPGRPPQLQLNLPAKALKGLALSHGETVSAVVRNSDTPGQLTLEISGKLLQAVSSLRLAAGTVLSLRVENNAGQLILHLTDREQRQLAYQQALRQTLPRQQSLKPLFERLQQLQPQNDTPAPPGSKPLHTRPHADGGQATTDTSTSAARETATPARPTAPQAIQQAVARLLAALPSPDKLGTIEGLKQAIASSGLFMENTLLANPSPATINSDVKNVLLRLARAIREGLQAEQKTAAQTPRGGTEPGRDSLQALLRQVESGLARIQLNQLHALASKNQADERLLLNLEIPLFNPQQKELDLLQLRIRRDRERGGNQGGPLWSVTLHLNPADYGDIRAVVTLSSGKISTTFWCEEEQTGELFRQELETLQQRLVEQGLEIGRCSAMIGLPPEEGEDAVNSGINGLIDTRA